MKYNKGFAPLILVAIIVGALVIGGGGYYVSKNKNEDKKVINNPDVDIKPKEDISKIPENQDVSSKEDVKKDNKIKNIEITKKIAAKPIDKYLTYYNKQYGYEYKYPKYLFASDDYTYQIGGSRISKDSCDTSLCESLYGIYILDNVNNLIDLKSKLESYYKCDSNSYWLNNYKLGGKLTIELNCSDVPTEYKSNTKIVLATINNNNKAYAVELSNRADDNDLNEFNNLVSSFKFTSSDIIMDNFAKCISNSGAKMYGASWCGACTIQKEMFGLSEKYLPYVECSISGEMGSVSAQYCIDNKIEGYPTWILSNGTRLGGFRELSVLAKETGCVLP